MDSIISRLWSTSEAGEGWSFMGSALDALKIGDPMDFLRERENDTPLKDEGIIL